MAEILRGAGVIARRQHPELVGALDHLLATGRLIAVLPGIYAAPAVTDLSVRIAAAMAWDPDAVLIGAVAARWSFWPEVACPRVDLAVGKRAESDVRGFGFVRRVIPPELTAVRRGVRMTVPALTALDLCGPLGGDAIDAALRSGTTLDDLERALALTPNRRGNRLRRQLLDESRDRPWSPPERRLHGLLRAAGISGWTGNLTVYCLGVRCHPDVGFRRERLAVEVDGREYHSSAAAFERDRARQNRMVRAGWTVLRFTPTMIDADPEGVIETIRETLAGLRWRSSQAS